MNLKSIKGFSLAEVMVAAGLIGGLSLALLQMTKTQGEVQKRSEVSFEITSMSSAIAQNLLNSDACTATFVAGTVVADGLIIPDIKNRRGDILYNTGTVYGNNQLQINQITLTNLVLGVGAGPNQYGEVNLDITFEKLSRLIKGNKIITKSFPVKLEVDGAGGLVKCYSATENAIATAKDQSCSSIGGVFNPATDNCNLSSHNVASPLSNSDAVSTQSLNDYVIGVLDPKYVNTSGDIMTGKLQVNAPIESDTEISLNGNCRTTFAQQSCPTGQVVRSVNTDGSVVCGNVTCPDSNTFYVGVNASGNPICKGFPTNTCSTNQYVAKVNADGSVECQNLPPGTNKDCTPGAIQRIDPTGNAYCTTSLPDDKNVFGKSCTTGNALRGFTIKGDPICVSIIPPGTCGGKRSGTSCLSGWSEKLKLPKTYTGKKCMTGSYTWNTYLSSGDRVYTSTKKVGMTNCSGNSGRIREVYTTTYECCKN